MTKLFQIISAVHAQTINQLAAPTPSTRNALNIFVDRIILWAIWVGGGVAIAYIIYGGFQYMMASGDKNKADQAKQTITFAVIGVIVIAFAIVIIRWTSASVNVLRSGGRAGF